MRNFLRHTFDAALSAALPVDCLPPHLAKVDELPDPAQGRIVVLGAGKASAAMAAVVESYAKAHWPEHWQTMSGLVITRYGHAVPCERIEIVEAAHPVPDETGYQAARRMLQQTVKGLSATDLVIALISGGGSALLSVPAAGISLAEKQAVHSALLASGATIHEMNAVRKHLSAIKGGRLALACAPARVLTLLISDVTGDDPGSIASGPTVPDSTTCQQALDILKKYAIEVPVAINQQLAQTCQETPKPGDSRFAANRVVMASTPAMALNAAAAYARSQGVACHILADSIEGEAQDVARMHAAIVRQVARYNQPFSRPSLLLSGGETSVTLQGNLSEQKLGEGGRNVDFLLALALEIKDLPEVYALAADTDGVDGSCEVAGAYVDNHTASRAAAQGISLTDALARHDGHGFFAALGDQLITGPTYTNVNDFRAIWIGASSHN